MRKKHARLSRGRIHVSDLLQTMVFIVSGAEVCANSHLLRARSCFSDPSTSSPCPLRSCTSSHPAFAFAALCRSCAAVKVTPTTLPRALAGSIVILQMCKTLTVILMPLHLPVASPNRSCRRNSFSMLIFSLVNRTA